MNLDPANLPAELRDPMLNVNVHEYAEAPEEMRCERRKAEKASCVGVHFRRFGTTSNLVALV